MAGWKLFRARKAHNELAATPQRTPIEDPTAVTRAVKAKCAVPRTEPPLRGTRHGVDTAVFAALTYETDQSQDQCGTNTVPLLGRHRRAPSVRSTRSLRSSRSGKSCRSQRQGQPVRSASRASGTDISRRCYVCCRRFSARKCETCHTTYSADPAMASESDAAPLDLEMFHDLVATNDYELIEAVVTNAFSSIPTVVSTFCIKNADEALEVNRDAVTTLYSILGSLDTTSAMRAVLQGAQYALDTPAYSGLNLTRLFYVLIILECPVFAECSMFTKLTGPLQKLARYASLRSRARVLLEHCMGLLANSANENQQKHYVNYLASDDPLSFQHKVELLNSYVSHRLMFHFEYKSEGANPRAHRERSCNEIKVDWYADDWRIAAFIRVLALFYRANEQEPKIPGSAFCNLVVDHVDLSTDYNMWKCSTTMHRHQTSMATPLAAKVDIHGSRRVYICGHPFLISIISKSRIFRHDMRLQLQESVFRATLTSGQLDTAAPCGQQEQNQGSSGSGGRYVIKQNTLHLRVRREQLLDDSFVLLEVPAADLKKQLRLEFVGEPGIDAGGPCKEWMLLLFRKLFDPDLKIFTQDEPNAAYWCGAQKPHYYELAGRALGLALRNSVMIDVGFSTLFFKMLLGFPYSLADMSQVWPSTARSLRAIECYQGVDFEEAFGLSFVAPDGTPLLENGDEQNVTIDNRTKYVRLVTDYMMHENEQVHRFKQGFHAAAGGDALKLFGPDELELLVRGDRKAVDVTALRGVAKYSHWRTKTPDPDEPVVSWFWDFFAALDPKKQALLLSFITATDRIPATGITNLQLRISCLGSSDERLPVSHTCFNQLGLYRYSTRAKLEQKLIVAITECEGFGIK